MYIKYETFKNFALIFLIISLLNLKLIQAFTFACQDNVTAPE